MSLKSKLERLKRWFVEIVKADRDPHSVALGAAIGMFVALQPCMGIQMSIAVPIAFLLRANKVIAAAMVWLTNPFTFIPIYFGCYLTGTLVYPSSRITLEEFERIAKHLTWNEFLQLGRQIVRPLLVGCLIQGLLWAVLTYFVVYRIAARVSARFSTSPAS